MNFTILASGKGKPDLGDGHTMIAMTFSEASAEEVGAALACAGFTVEVKDGYGKLLHEFFPQENR